MQRPRHSFNHLLVFLLHCMLCHSKKCYRPRTSRCHKNSELEQNTGWCIFGMYDNMRLYNLLVMLLVVTGSVVGIVISIVVWEVCECNSVENTKSGNNKYQLPHLKFLFVLFVCTT